MKPLPEFRPRPRERVERFAQDVLTDYQNPPVTHFRELIIYPDGHFRVIFDPAYFVVPGEQPAPSKSQWNSLKKKFKRHDPLVFIFKDHGEIPCGEAKATCFYIDFGFLAAAH